MQRLRSTISLKLSRCCLLPVLISMRRTFKAPTWGKRRWWVRRPRRSFQSLKPRCESIGSILSLLMTREWKDWLNCFRSWRNLFRGEESFRNSSNFAKQFSRTITPRLMPTWKALHLIWMRWSMNWIWKVWIISFSCYSKSHSRKINFVACDWVGQLDNLTGFGENSQDWSRQSE